MGDPDPTARFEQLVRASRYLVLGTADADGRPWVAPVWFATADALTFWWASKPGARHSADLELRPQVAITVFDTGQPPGTGAGAYLEALAEPVPDADLDAGLAVFGEARVRDGTAPWRRERVTGTARHRLYRARATARFVLDDHDERVRLPG